MKEPAYMALYERGILEKRVDSALNRLKACDICPWNCSVDRTAGKIGVCRTGRFARVASFGPHFGEEAPLVGERGSGTIFFSACNMFCTFCQNYDISHLDHGQEVDAKGLADMMLSLESQGCHNINLVSPSHVVSQILEALLIAVRKGLRVPLVYNTGGYDSVSALKLLDGIVDIYMPDFKFWDDEPARKYLRVNNYRSTAMNAIKEMHAQVGDLVLDNRGIAIRGLIVRHLVMPFCVAGTKEVMKFLAKEISKHTYVNIMDQYRPYYRAIKDKTIGRGITRREFLDAVLDATSAGLTRLDSVQI